MLESGFRAAITAHWADLVGPAGEPFTMLGKRERSVAAVLALVLEFAFIVMWIKQTHVDNPWARSGIPDAVVDIQNIPMMGADGRSVTGGGRRRAGKGPAQKIPPAVVQPSITPTPDTLTKWVPKDIPVEPPKSAQEEEAQKPKQMTESEAADFRRQWAALQDDLQKKALDNSHRDNLKTESEEAAKERKSEMAKLRERDKPIQTVLQEHGQVTEHTSRQDAIDGSIFAGELCVTGSRGQGDVQIALPCVGDNFVTDFSWYARLRAPKRGEPSYRPVDPQGRVYVRNYRFAPATMAAFAEASEQLRKIQVTMRMVYLPDLRYPLQLLSRDNNAGAIGAEAFATEEEMAAYLQNWADNVRRWTAPHPPADTPPANAPIPVQN